MRVTHEEDFTIVDLPAQPEAAEAQLCVAMAGYKDLPFELCRAPQLSTSFSSQPPSAALVLSPARREGFPAGSDLETGVGR